MQKKAITNNKHPHPLFAADEGVFIYSFFIIVCASGQPFQQ
nr:MAG TPA: hypothetical protein [Caudoviricetes sp.]